MKIWENWCECKKGRMALKWMEKWQEKNQVELKREMPLIFHYTDASREIISQSKIIHFCILIDYEVFRFHD